MSKSTITKKATVTKNSKAFPSKQQSEDAMAKTLWKILLSNERDPFPLHA